MYLPEFPVEAIAVDRRAMFIHILVANKWTLLCLFFGAIAAVIMNKLKEVQKLSIGFSWWDKHAQVQVSVESISSFNTGNSFTVTADGVFSSNHKTVRSKERALQRSTRGNCEKRMKITCQKYVPRLTVTLQSGLHSSEPQKAGDSVTNDCKTLEMAVEVIAEGLQLCKSFSTEEVQSRQFKSQPHFAMADLSSGIEDRVCGCESEDTTQFVRSRLNAVNLPEWASSLLEPTEQIPISNSQPYLHLPKVKAWDSLLNMRMEMSVTFEGRSTSPVSLPSSENASRTLLVRGPHHIARAKDKVVKIWDCSRKLFLERLQVAEGIISALDVDWEGKKAFVGNLKTYLSVWDLHRGKCVRTIHSDDQLKAIKSNASTCILTGSRAFQDPLAFVKLWDARILTQQAGIVSSTIPSVSAMESRGHECYVRDSKAFISAYDLRMLGGLTPLQSFGIRNKKLPLQAMDSASFKAFPGHVDDEWWDADSHLSDSIDHDCGEDEESWIKPQCFGNTRTCLLSRFISAVCSFAMSPSLPSSQ